MALLTLIPQPPAFVAWEDQVTDELGAALDACRSDAQGILEAHGEVLVSAWLRQVDAKTAATLVIEAAHPKDSEGT